MSAHLSSLANQQSHHSGLPDHFILPWNPADSGINDIWNARWSAATTACGPAQYNVVVITRA